MPLNSKLEKGARILAKTLGIRLLLTGVDIKEIQYALDADDGFTLSEISLKYAQEKELGVDVKFLEILHKNLLGLSMGEAVFRGRRGKPD